MNKIKILIADDHAVVRDGSRQILEHELTGLVAKRDRRYNGAPHVERR